MAKNKKRVCKAVGCEVDLTDAHHFTTRCADCYPEYRKEYLRMYMAKRVAKEKIEKLRHVTSEDIQAVTDHHMTGLGTFTLPNFDPEDSDLEWERIQKLKRMTRGE